MLASVVLVLGFCQTPASADTSTVSSRYGRDNLGITDDRTDLNWLSNESSAGLLQIGLHATRAAAAELNGLPPDARWTSMGGGMGWIVRFGDLESRAFGGVDVVTKPASSWRLQLQETLSISGAPGLNVRANAASGWMDGWLTYAVRSTSAAAALAYASTRTWAEAGGIADFRSGGLLLPTSIPVSVPDNRLLTAYGWGTHAWTAWLLLGASVRWSDSRVDLHQPIQMLNGVITYLDYPYPTPHDETALGALAEIHVWRAKFKTNWPVVSWGRYCYDNSDPGSAPSYYRGRDMTMAEVRGGVDIPLEHWNLTVDAEALSRPYRPHAWFSQDAWNHFGIVLTVRYATTSSRRTQ